jgi:hypothetical protein
MVDDAKKPRFYAYVPDKWNSEKPDPKLFVVGDSSLEIKARACKLAHEQKSDVEIWNTSKPIGDVRRTGKACRFVKK